MGVRLDGVCLMRCASVCMAGRRSAGRSAERPAGRSVGWSAGRSTGRSAVRGCRSGRRSGRRCGRYRAVGGVAGGRPDLLCGFVVLSVSRVVGRGCGYGSAVQREM